jgi:transposase
MVKSVLYIIPLYYCHTCKKTVSGIPLDVLPKMKFGTNITVLTPNLKYKYRLTFKLVRKFFKEFFGFTASEGAYAYQIQKLAKILRKPYKEIEKEIKDSKSVGIGETGEKWLGGKAWGWKYISKLASLYKITRTRGHKELYETLGEGYGGGVNCDGHTAYNLLKKARRQRCWEHVWRLARLKINEGKAGKELEVFYKKLVHIIKLADNYKEKNFPFKNPEKVKDRYRRMVGAHIEKLYRDSTIKKIISYIHNYWDDLFTFLEYEGLNYHNNDTERDIREEVIQRKISGGCKSDDGAECRSILRSVIRTYEKKGINFMDEVKKLIVASNLAE